MDRHHSRCYNYFGDQHSHYSYFSRAISHWNRVGMDLFGDDNKPGRSAKISDCISATLLLFTCEVMSNSVTPGNAARQGPLFSSVTWSLLRFAHWVSDAIWPSHPLSLSFSFALNLSQHQGLSQWVSFHIKWPKYWRFSYRISLSNEYSGLFSLRTNMFDLLAVQGTLKSIL